MKLISYLIILVFLNSCSSSTISFYVVDESSIEFETFSFYAREKLNSKKIELDSLVESLITTQLVTKGYKKSYPSEMYLSYKIISDKTYKTHTDTNNYLGPSNYNNATPNYYYVTERKEGVFMIEMFNQEDKLLWQGSKAFKVNNSTDTKVLLEKYIEKIMASFKLAL